LGRSQGGKGARAVGALGLRLCWADAMGKSRLGRGGGEAGQGAGWAELGGFCFSPFFIFFSFPNLFSKAFSK